MRNTQQPKNIKSLLDLQFDTENINQQTRRSYNDIYDSQEYSGWGRPLLVDAEGNIIAGNGSTEVAVDRYEGSPPEPIVIRSDGTRPIIHQRTDLYLHDEEDDRARALSYADNASTRHSQWDRRNLAIAMERGRNLSRHFTDEELHDIMADERDSKRTDSPEPRIKIYTLSVTCKDQDDCRQLAERLTGEGYGVVPVIKAA